MRGRERTKQGGRCEGPNKGKDQGCSPAGTPRSILEQKGEDHYNNPYDEKDRGGLGKESDKAGRRGSGSGTGSQKKKGGWAEKANVRREILVRKKRCHVLNSSLASGARRGKRIDRGVVGETGIPPITFGAVHSLGR